ncbi:MAG: DUF3048 domain-containing protein [Patescibacteria group bacterium]
MGNKKSIGIIILLVVIYIISSATSYALFSQGKNAKAQNAQVPSPSTATNAKDSKVVFNQTLPKTEACPLNGALYSSPQREWWEKHRPLGVMIENHKEARSQSGLSFADVIYEAVAEGGITRFLAMYYCQDAGTIGPIRSARTYFIDFVSEYGSDPLYVHVGGANTPGPANALGQINDYGWTGYNDINQFSIGFPTFWRDYDRLGHPAATEHTMYSTTEKLWKFATTRGLTNVGKDETPWTKGFVPYAFKDDVFLSELPKKQTVHLEFWSRDPDYYVDWIFDPSTNLYKRNNGKVVHIDRDNNQTLTTKNIVVLFMQQYNANDGYEDNVHLLYKDKGVGKAIVFMDGTRIDGTWRKDKRVSRTLLFDSNGTPIKFNKGTIWFSILPTDGIVTVQ